MQNFLNKEELVVPTADTTDNAYSMDVIGNKTDAAAAGAVSATESLMAYAKQNVTNTEAANALLASTVSEGTFSYLDAGAEQTIVEITPTSRVFISGIWLDLSNMTQDGTIRFSYKIDGTNYREFQESSFTVATDSDGVLLGVNMMVDDDFKVTYQEGADEGAARDLPYQLFYEVKQ